LNSIAKTTPVRLHAFVLREDLRAANQSWVPQSAPTFSAEINLYCVESDADAIGAALSKASIFIQPPRHGRGPRYYNPHVLHIEGHDSQTFDLIAGHDLAGDTLSGSHSHSVEASGLSEANAADSGAVVESILDSLAHNVQVAEIPVDRRIKRKLLP
jgi:hypothetical protein